MRILCCGLILLLATPALAGDGIPFELGNVLTSSLTPAGDTDEFAFDGVAGSKVAISVAGEKGGLLPTLALFGPGGGGIDISSLLAVKVNKAQLKKLILPTTGRYVLSVRSREGTTGNYTVKTKGKAPKSIKFPPAVLNPGETLDFPAFGTDGATISVKVKAAKDADFAAVEVYGPNGGAAAGGLAAFGPGGGLRKTAFKVFDGFGVYGVKFGGASVATPLTVALKVTMPKIAKRTIGVSGTEPRPTAVDPVAGSTGTSVGVTGSGFVSGSRVFVGGVEMINVLVISSVQVRGTIAAGTPVGPALDVVVLNPDGQENTLPAAFTVVIPPSVLAVSPLRALHGDTVTITGLNFEPGAEVRFDFALASSTTYFSSSELTAVIPLSGFTEGALDVEVTNPGGYSSRKSDALIVEPEPTLDSVDPAAGERGDTAVLNGTNFTAQTVVTFDDTPADVTDVTTTALTVLVPQGVDLGLADVTVTKPYGGTATLTDGYEVLVTIPPYQGLVISGIIDGPRSGGLPKAIELHAAADIADLSVWAIEVGSNGNAFTGTLEYTLSGSANAGDYLYIASESTGFTAYFGSAPDFVTTVANINGNDAVALYENGTVVDYFGDPADASGQTPAWDYLDGYAYRRNGLVRSLTFDEAEWTLSGASALFPQGSSGVNGDSGVTVPFGTYQHQ